MRPWMNTDQLGGDHYCNFRCLCPPQNDYRYPRHQQTSNKNRIPVFPRVWEILYTPSKENNVHICLFTVMESWKIKAWKAWKMQDIFYPLKGNITSRPVLSFPDSSWLFILECWCYLVCLWYCTLLKRVRLKSSARAVCKQISEERRKGIFLMRQRSSGRTFSLQTSCLCLLPLDSFSLIADHEALHHAFQERKIHGRLVRWIEFLAVNGFKIIYLPEVDIESLSFCLDTLLLNLKVVLRVRGTCSVLSQRLIMICINKAIIR